jgi:hypothetical protein
MEELSKKDLIEGPEAFKRFDKLVGKLLSARREEILRRDAAHKKRVAASGRNADQSLSSPRLPPILTLSL